MKILVTGCNGLLGQRIVMAYANSAGDLHGIDLFEEPFSPKIEFNYRQLDLTNAKDTVKFIQNIDPEIIIHTAAMTPVDKCETEREECWQSNVNVTESIVKGASKVGSRLIFISSDYVFDGSNGPYGEDDPPNPISYYGRSKLAAENIIRGAMIPWTIIRTIVLYGVGVKISASFVTWLLGMLRDGKPVKIVNDQWGNSTLVNDIVSGVQRIIQFNRTGLFHIGGSDYMTRYEFANLAAEIFDLDKALISPISTAELNQAAPRPLKSGLKIDKAEKELFIKFHNTDQSLKIYKNQEKSLPQSIQK